MKKSHRKVSLTNIYKTVFMLNEATSPIIPDSYKRFSSFLADIFLAQISFLKWFCFIRFLSRREFEPKGGNLSLAEEQSESAPGSLLRLLPTPACSLNDTALAQRTQQCGCSRRVPSTRLNPETQSRADYPMRECAVL